MATNTIDKIFEELMEMANNLTTFPLKETKKKNNDDDLTIKRIFINEEKRCVVILWSDDTKTKATCHVNDDFDPQVGFCVALAKKVCGGKEGIASFVETLGEKTSKKCSNK